MGDGQAAVAAERLGRDLDAGRGLTALVLVDVDHAHDALDRRLVVAQGDDLGDAAILLDVLFDDGVENFVRRQGVLVQLARLEFGAGRFGDHGLGDDGLLADRVAIAGEAVDQRFGHVFDHRVAAGHITVKGGVAGGELALVAGRQHDPAELVRQRHDDVAANARLDVLLSRALPATVQVGERPLEHRQVGGVGRLDRHDEEAHAEVVGQVLRVFDAALGRVARGHADSDDVLGAERVDRDDGDEAGVDATGEGNEHLTEARLPQVVPCAGDERLVDLRLEGGRRFHPRLYGRPIGGRRAAHEGVPGRWRCVGQLDVMEEQVLVEHGGARRQLA